MKTFYPDKEVTKFVYLRKTALVISMILISFFITYLKRPIPNPTSLITWLGITTIFLIWILSESFYTHISMDDKRIVFYYFTIFQNKKELIIPLAKMDFTFMKSSSLRQPNCWTLEISKNTKKKLSIETGQSGFSQNTLEEIVQELEKSKIKSQTN
jgi:hypothetical protein